MKVRRIIKIAGLISLFLLLFSVQTQAAVTTSEPGIRIDANGINIQAPDSPAEYTTSIQIVILLTILTLLPSILIMLTSFTRVIIILSFIKNAMGTQQMPPGQVITGFAIILTIFIMMPVATDINDKAIAPYAREEITQTEAIDIASSSIKVWMLRQINHNDDKMQNLKLFTDLANIQLPVVPEDLSLTVVIPAFILSELTVAFRFGFLIYLPFLVIDMVVASTLMSMGMMMLPPIMISLPFKIMLFVLIDGWGMLTREIVRSFIW